MQLSKLGIAALILIARACSAKIVIPTYRQEESTSSLVDDLVNIVTSCYGHRIDGVGLAGNLPATLSQTLSAKHSIPVALIANTMKPTDRLPAVPRKFRHKLQVFIVEASSWQLLAATIQKNIRQTIWWNNMASYFIVDRSPGCAKKVMQGYLLTAWYRNILNAKVICYDPNVGRIIVSFNPFTSQAPAPWERFSVITEMINHPFTLFSRKYRRNNEICVNLDVDKTKNLGGYTISVEGFAPTTDYTIRSKTPVRQADYDRIINDQIFGITGRSMNATLAYTGQQRWSERRMYADIEKINWVYGEWGEKTSTFPYDQIDVIILSKFRRPNPQQRIIVTGIDIYSRIGIGVVDLITVLFLKVFIHQALMPALVNVVRITCNNRMINLPHNDLSRMYITSFLSFAAMMHVFYQGGLASLMMSEIPIRNVDTVEDLLDFDYRIYGRWLNTARLDDPLFKQRFTVMKDNEHAKHCVRRAQQNLSTACLWWGHIDTFEMARELNLHVSGENVFAIYMAYRIRQDWPLEERVNIILRRFVEADVVKPWDIKCKPVTVSDFQIDKIAVSNKKFKSVELGQLAVPFLILGTGLVVATVAFIVEWVIAYEFSIEIESR